MGRNTRSEGRIPARCLPGFTLMELLVVVSIIAILLGLIVPTYYSVREHARKAKARATAKYLETAFREYYNYYRTWPTCVSGGDRMAVSGELYRVMQGQNSKTNAFFEFEVARDSSAPTNAACDPWKYAPDGSLAWRPYCVQFDHDFDNQISHDGSAIYRSVIVWSPGPDRLDYTEDDLGSWE